MAISPHKKILHRFGMFLIFLYSLIVPVAAQQFVQEQISQQIPKEAIPWINLVVSPWPTYTFGIMYFVILMGVLMGAIVYQALAKTKIFGGEFGGAQGSIQTLIAVILTLIIVKFMPFSYYVMLAAILIIVAAFFGLFTIVTAASSYAGAEGKWKNSFTAISIGIVLIITGYFLIQMLDQFQRLGVVTTVGSLTADWPGAIAWLAIVVGLIFTVGGVGYAFKGIGGGTAAGGGGTSGRWFGGGGPAYKNKREINDAVNAGKYSTQVHLWAKQMERSLVKVAGLITNNNATGAKAEVKGLMAIHKTQLKKLKTMRSEAENAMKDAAAIEGVEPIDIARWEGAAQQLEASIDKITAYEERLELQVGNGLHELMQELDKPVYNTTRITEIITTLRRELAGIDAEGLKIGQVSERVVQVLSAVDGRLSAPAGATPAGGRIRGP